LFTDDSPIMESVAPDLRGLTGIRIAQADAVKSGVRLEFEISEPAQILVGFFPSEKKGAAAAPPANEWEPVLHNGIESAKYPGFTVWSHAVPVGKSQLDFGRRAYVVLGFVKRDFQLEPRMVFFSQAGTTGGPISIGSSSDVRIIMQPVNCIPYENSLAVVWRQEV
jgi:hypothetical protein